LSLLIANPQFHPSGNDGAGKSVATSINGHRLRHTIYVNLNASRSAGTIVSHTYTVSEVIGDIRAAMHADPIRRGLVYQTYSNLAVDIDVELVSAPRGVALLYVVYMTEAPEVG